jgi:hypothetical protein
MMGEKRTEEYKPCFRAFRDMIICSGKVIGQNKYRVMCVNHFNDPYMPGNVFSITPILQHSSTPLV